MTSDHYYSLKSLKRPSYNILSYEWLLGIQVQEYSYDRYANSECDSQSFLFDENDDSSTKSAAESDREADSENIESQRDINPDEFAEASYEVPPYKDKLDSIIVLEDGFKPVGDKQGFKSYIHAWLSYTNPMDVTMAKNIKDVWDLPVDLKWSLYKFWLEGYIRKKNERITELHQKIKEKYNELQEMRMQEDIQVCRQALVVGMTTTGAAKYRHIVQHLNPRIVIVEEAAELLESHIVTTLAPGTQHLILIGDHQQLRPSPTVHLLATKYGMNISLFERMIENGLECHKLEIQHRMRPEIASLLVPHIYTKLHNHESVETLENIKGVAKNVFFVNHSYYELQESDSKSKVNVHEANFMLKFCKYLINQGYKPSQITVLTTYSGQLFEFNRSPLRNALSEVRFTGVDNYQGEENDIILISFVRSNEDGQIGFLKTSNRVCVALSRAKKGLYCIGNFDLLSEKSNLWKNIVETLESNKAIGPSLMLTCQNHPDISRAVAHESDFDFVPEGGCTQQCTFRLSCGHLCSLKCHPYDPKHEYIQCPKPCINKCREGHLCAMKCFQECPPCPVVVSKTIEICGHTIQVPCHLKQKTACTDPCEKLLPCGHKCSKKCGDSCALECSVKVPIQSSICGHEVNIECSKSKHVELLMIRCNEPCGAGLPCGHKCSGSCGICYQGRLHAICKKPCNRKLVCGHYCNSLCSRNCPPCEKACENYCIHRKCTKKCGEPCEKCTKPCEWTCSHRKCNRLCGEPCDRTACNESCQKVLKCKHPCIGICGELCPAECRICDKQKVEEACFERDAEADSKFVCLEECGHIFESNWLKQWMSREKKDIRYKACPSCKAVIRNPPPFERNIEPWFKNIEKVKKALSGNEDYNDNLKEVLRHRIKNEHEEYSSSFSTSRVKLEEALRSERKRKIEDLFTMENIMNITKIWPSRKSNHYSYIRHNYFMLQVKNQKATEKIMDYLNIAEKWLDSFIAKRFLIASEQQLKDLTWEVHRLKLVDELGSLMNKVKLNKQACIHLNKSLELVLSYSPFREVEFRQIISELQNLSKYVPDSSLNISDLQKQAVLKIMSFSDGHWFLCENGHAYSAVKCGDATEESNCYECTRKVIYIKPLLPKAYQPPKRQKQKKGHK